MSESIIPSFFDLIVNAFESKQDLILSDEQLPGYDEYIDLLIEANDIKRHSSYDFTGEGLAKIINEKLKQKGSQLQISPLQSNDNRIDTRVKGQGVYFLVDNKIAILTWSLSAVTFWEPRN